MCPEDKPGRGSGSVPRKLHVIVDEDRLQCAAELKGHTGRENARRQPVPQQDLTLGPEASWLPPVHRLSSALRKNVIGR